eukprot:TRINITY_DN17563_c0_g1_i1.p1 TRINITY_DN17563_c0_g1~~TRINITY_DN17563_c0_g1_i1.p1  ORF type:complete len:323 (+),score=6.76 TRINITY_DN17563_c0_g1_i1:47-970(+)
MLDNFLFPIPQVSYDSHSFPGRLVMVTLDGKSTRDSIPMVVLRPSRPGKERFALFCCHANASDLGHMELEGNQLADRLNCVVFIMEYPGYGICNGKPSFKSINSAAWACFRTVVDVLKVKPADIVLFGRSIGTGVASRIASRTAVNGENVRGVILVSPYTSILDIVNDHVSCAGILFAHRWQPVLDLPKADSPVLILHGVRDNLIRVDHSEKLLMKLKGYTDPPLDTFFRVPPGRGCYPHDVYTRISSEADHNQWNYNEDILLPMKNFTDRLFATSRAMAVIDLNPLLKSTPKPVKPFSTVTCSSFR